VLYLAKRNGPKHATPILCPWSELLAFLVTKYPDLSMPSLTELVHAHENLFLTISSGLWLRQLNHNFVKHYFDLATSGLDVIDEPKTLSCSSLQPCSVNIASSVNVVGLVGKVDAGLVLFQFDDNRAYKLKKQLDKKNYEQGQMFVASVCFRQKMSTILQDECLKKK
jgi:hypothetical protein